MSFVDGLKNRPAHTVGKRKSDPRQLEFRKLEFRFHITQLGWQGTASIHGLGRRDLERREARQSCSANSFYV